MFEKLNLFYLVISFCIGIGYIYIITPPPSVVHKFPSPLNTNKLVYRDGDDNCYKYKHKLVNCNVSPSNILDQPVMENFQTLNKKDKI